MSVKVLAFAHKDVSTRWAHTNVHVLRNFDLRAIIRHVEPWERRALCCFMQQVLPSIGLL